MGRGAKKWGLPKQPPPSEKDRLCKLLKELQDRLRGLIGLRQS